MYCVKIKITENCIYLDKIKVAVIREEGINGDREMAASLLQAGFEVWDVTMQDLLQNHVTLDSFRGIIFPGGFSYAGNKKFEIRIDSMEN